MSPTELARLAAMANLLRPQWPISSVTTWLNQRHAARPYRDVAVALAYVAADPDTKTPARMDGPGPWWVTGEAVRTPQPPGPSDICDHGRDVTTCHHCKSEGPRRRPLSETDDWGQISKRGADAAWAVLGKPRDVAEESA